MRSGGLLHKRALILRPAGLIARLLAGANCHFGLPVQVSLETCSVNGEVFDAIVLANGMRAAQLAPHLPMEARLGQVDFVTRDVAAPPSALASGTYALATGGDRLWGCLLYPFPSPRD